MKSKILIVDDVEINRELLKEMLSDSYEVLEAENGQDALRIIKDEMKELKAILLDLVMPVMDGLEVLIRLKKYNITDKIPVLVISGESNAEYENKCFKYGVYDFIGRPFKANLVTKRVANMINLYAYKNELEVKVSEQTKVLRKAYDTLKEQAAELAGHNQDIIDMLGTVVEYRNLESGEHIQRVKGYTRIIAEGLSRDYPEYNLTPENIEVIVSASSLHDLGKIAIPDKILLKPGRLDEDEYEFMKSHTIRGCEILASMHTKWNKKVEKTLYEIIRHHHERYDGKGYPDNLKGDDIPISAQIVSIADVYDALVNERCYKDAYSLDEAYHMMISGECGVFSPKLMEVFRKSKKQFEDLATMEL